MICVLEAAARFDSPSKASVFQEAIRHPDRLVRWTAVRLLGELPPPPNGLAPSEKETDPLVKARHLAAFGKPHTVRKKGPEVQPPRAFTPRPDGTRGPG